MALSVGKIQADLTLNVQLEGELLAKLDELIAIAHRIESVVAPPLSGETPRRPGLNSTAAGW